MKGSLLQSLTNALLTCSSTRLDILAASMLACLDLLMTSPLLHDNTHAAFPLSVAPLGVSMATVFINMYINVFILSCQCICWVGVYLNQKS